MRQFYPQVPHRRHNQMFGTTAILCSWALPTLLFNQCTKKSVTCLMFSEHHKIKTVHFLYSNFMGSQFLNELNTKLLACETMQSVVQSPLICLKYCTFTTLPTLSPLHQTYTCSSFNNSTEKYCGFHSFFTFWSPHLEQSPPPPPPPRTPFKNKLISLLEIFQLTNTVLMVPIA